MVVTLDGWEMCYFFSGPFLPHPHCLELSDIPEEQFALKTFTTFQSIQESGADSENSQSLAMKYFIRQYTGLHYPDLNDKVAMASFHLTTRDQSLKTSILSAGTFFGAIIAGDIADFIGRRMTIIAGCFIFSIGCILKTAPTGLAVMVVGRVVAGFGVGFISAIVILYMSVSTLDFTF